MDLFFISISLVFIFFLVVSYFLGIIKLSSPLIIIYLVFCFTHVINNDIDIDKSNIPEILTEKNINNTSSNDDISIINDKNILNSQNTEYKSPDSDNIEELSKPIVSFNPKPIKIDSNLIIQKNKEKDLSKVPKLIKVDEKPDVKSNDDIAKTLNLKEIMICRGVYKRNPIKPGFSFTNNVDSLYCYTKISNTGPKQEIKHAWYYQDELITSVVYNIKTSYNYRSWSRKTILPHQIGKWRVDIVDSKNYILGSRNFQISSLNDLY